VLKRIFKRDQQRQDILIKGNIVPNPGRCIQCGICSYYCPVDIDVRRHAWLGIHVVDSHCLTCGECVARCPRGVLRFEYTDLFDRDHNLGGG
jgi:ferredoxin